MAGAGGVRAGKAYVELYADETALIGKLKSMQDKLQSWGASVSTMGKTIAAAGAAVLAPLLAATKLFDSMGSQINDFSAMTGVSAEALSTFGYAAEQSGSNLEAVVGGIGKMSKLIVAAAGGSGKAAAALAELGFSAEDLMKMKPEEQFRVLSKALVGIENPTERAALAMKIFGKSGAGLLPMQSQLEQLEARARALGLQMSGEDVAAADTLGDAWGDLMSVGKMLAFQVGAALAPAMTSLLTNVAEAVGGFIRWAQSNRETIVVIAQFAAGAVVAGGAIYALGTALTFAGSVVGGLATLFASLGAIVTFCAGLFAAITSPIGIVVAALVGAGIELGILTTWFLTSTETGKAFAAALMEAFDGLLESAKTTFGGMQDAIAAGDIPLAFQIMTQSLKTEWTIFTSGFSSAWLVVENVVTASIEVIKIALKSLFPMLNAATKLIGPIAEFAGKAIDAGAGLLGGGGEKQLEVLEDVEREQDKLNKLMNEARKKRAEAEIPKVEKPNIPPAMPDDGEEQDFSDNVNTSPFADVAEVSQDVIDAQIAAMNAAEAAKFRWDTTAGDPFSVAPMAEDFSWAEQAAQRAAEDRMKNIGDMKSLQARTSATGTFSAIGAGSIGGGKQLDAISENTKQTAIGIKKLSNKGVGIPVT